MSDAETPPPTEPPSVSALLAHAEQMLARGRPSDALPLLDRLAEQAPTEPQVYVLRAQASRQAGGLGAAFVDVRAALALARRQGIDLHPLQALSDAIKRQLVGAEEVPLLAVSRATTILRRWLLDDRQRPAEELAESLLAYLGNYRPLLLLAAGLSRLSRGRADLATADLEAAIEAMPTLWPAAYACGQALLQLGDRPGALRAFAHTAEQHHAAQAGFVLSEAEDLLSAVPGLGFSPRSLAFERASLLHALDRSDEALLVLEGLLVREPEAADAHLSRAVLLFQRGRLDEALEALQFAESTLRPEDRSLELEDPLRRIQTLRMATLRSLQRHDEAEALAEQLSDPAQNS